MTLWPSRSSRRARVSRALAADNEHLQTDRCKGCPLPRPQRCSASMQLPVRRRDSAAYSASLFWCPCALADDDIVKKTTLREVKLLRMLRSQPNIVHLHDAFRRRGKLYLVFEYVERNLLEVLEEHPDGLGAEMVRRLVFQLCVAIEWCHRNRVIHRDIKPENLLVNPADKSLKLCDFGFARTVSSKPTDLTDYVATRWYRAPELLLGSTRYDFSVDIWAIGCIMGELADGQPLFPGQNEVDQLYVIQKAMGALIPAHKQLFLRNPRFQGLTFPTMTSRGIDHLMARYARLLPREAIDFQQACLKMDPSRRLSAVDCVSHPWFAGLPEEHGWTPPLSPRAAAAAASSAAAAAAAGPSAGTDDHPPRSARHRKPKGRKADAAAPKPARSPPDHDAASPSASDAAGALGAGSSQSHSRAKGPTSPPPSPSDLTPTAPGPHGVPRASSLASSTGSAAAGRRTDAGFPAEELSSGAGGLAGSGGTGGHAPSAAARGDARAAHSSGHSGGTGDTGRVSPRAAAPAGAASRRSRVGRRLSTEGAGAAAARAAVALATGGRHAGRDSGSQSPHSSADGGQATGGTARRGRRRTGTGLRTSGRAHATAGGAGGGGAGGKDDDEDDESAAAADGDDGRSGSTPTAGAARARSRGGARGPRAHGRPGGGGGGATPLDAAEALYGQQSQAGGRRRARSRQVGGAPTSKSRGGSKRHIGGGGGGGGGGSVGHRRGTGGGGGGGASGGSGAGIGGGGGGADPMLGAPTGSGVAARALAREMAAGMHGGSDMPSARGGGIPRGPGGIPTGGVSGAGAGVGSSDGSMVFRPLSGLRASAAAEANALDAATRQSLSRGASRLFAMGQGRQPSYGTGQPAVGGGGVGSSVVGAGAGGHSRQGRVPSTLRPLGEPGGRLRL